MQMQQQQLLDCWMKRHRAKCWHEEGCVRGLLAEMKGPTEAEVERQGGVGAGRLQAALKPELGGSSACAALELEPDPEGRKGGLSDPDSRRHCRPGQAGHSSECSAAQQRRWQQRRIVRRWAVGREQTGLGWGRQSGQAARQGEGEGEGERMDDLSQCPGVGSLRGLGEQAGRADSWLDACCSRRKEWQPSQFPHHVAFPAWPCLLSFPVGAGYLGQVRDFGRPAARRPSLIGKCPV